MKKEVILVVDDNRQIARITAEDILPGLGYETMVAYNGRVALDVIRKNQGAISLMLLDLQMPDCSGLDVLRQLDSEGIRVPTILVTAHGSEQVAVDAFKLGVANYLNKPVEMEQLEIAISQALTESRLRQEKANLNAQLRDQVSWLTTLSNVGRSVTSSLSVNTVLRRIVEAGVHLTRADQGFLALVEPGSENLFLRAVKNIDQERIDTFHIPVRDTLVGKVLETHRPLRRTQAINEKAVKVSTGMLVYSLIHVPLLYKERVLGVLSVNNHISRRSFNEKDEAVLVSLADYAAIAIENANLYEQAKQEITERKRIEQALRESEERYALAVQGANDGLWDWNLRTNKVYFSPRWKELLGLGEDGIGSNLTDWFNRIHPEDLERTKLEMSTHIKRMTPHFVSEYRLLHNDGAYRWVLCRGAAVWSEEGLAVRMAGSLSDITDRKLAERQLLHDAFHDTLTGLPNRALFMDRLNLAIERSKRRSDYLFAVLFLDLDRFKDVNDSLGHLVGDQLLIEVAEQLRKGLRAVDTLARFGGDEFIILLEDIQEASNVNRVTEWIQRRFASPFEVAGHEIGVTISIGVVLSTTSCSNAEDVIRDADIAMYVAKGRGRARSEIFETTMRSRLIQRLDLENELRRAIETDELRICYQPIAELENGKLIGFEALVRWQHPTKGLVPPADFIALAEDTGLIIAIDRWVLSHTAQDFQRWIQESHFDAPLTVSVNISSKHVANPDLADYVSHVLQETGLEPQNLKLEITERTILGYNEFTLAMFSKLQAMGVQLQIDDFGTGYSSLGYLSRFQVNALKIDQSFVDGIVDDSSQRDIVKAIITLTERLNVRVIAEGVETKEQLQQLRELGCEWGQGYLMAMPLRSEQVIDLLKNLKASKGTLFALNNISI